MRQINEWPLALEVIKAIVSMPLNLWESSLLISL